MYKSEILHYRVYIFDKLHNVYYSYIKKIILHIKSNILIILYSLCKFSSKKAYLFYPSCGILIILRDGYFRIIKSNL